MRLQKFMADAGIASRRKCEEYIRQGLVTVNGEVATIGTVVDIQTDVVVYNGNAVVLSNDTNVIAFYKPQCVMCTANDPEGRRTVMDYFKDYPHRLYNVGRLDYDSEGLLLMTNDGELAYKLTHPKFSVGKTYLVTINGTLADSERFSLERGVDIGEGGLTSPAKITQTRKDNRGNTSFYITIHEGKNRQIRRMVAAIGHKTLLLRRIAIGELTLGELKPGTWRILSEDEVQFLLSSCEK